jgi:hypothetical protein
LILWQFVVLSFLNTVSRFNQKDLHFGVLPFGIYCSAAKQMELQNFSQPSGASSWKLKWPSEIFYQGLLCIGSRDNAIRTTIEGWAVVVWITIGARFLSSPKCSDWFWDTRSLLPSGYRGSFPGGKVARV